MPRSALSRVLKGRQAGKGGLLETQRGGSSAWTGQGSLAGGETLELQGTWAASPLLPAPVEAARLREAEMPSKEGCRRGAVPEPAWHAGDPAGC